MTDDDAPDGDEPAEDPQPQAAAESVSPGFMVRQARERQNLSLAGLTAQTMLNRSTVEALENNEFGRLSQPVYVRGYYRKCAKVLGISEDEIMAAYRHWAGESGPQPTAAPESVGLMPEDVTPPGRRALTVVLAVLAVLVIGLLAWAWLPQFLSVGQATGALQSGTAQSSAAKPPQPGGQAPTPQARAADAESAAAPALAPAKLVLRFQGSSSVRVRDASGAVLLDGEVGGGNLRVVQGRAPYDVSLGNAPAVVVAIDGRRVNTAQATGDDNSVRLTIEAGGGQ